jgi:hypothetical protein
MEAADFDLKLITCKVIDTKSEEFIIAIETSSSFEDLKNKILEHTSVYEESVEFRLILNGRVIRDEKELVSSVVKTPSATFFLINSNVHGGCCRK